MQKVVLVICLLVAGRSWGQDLVARLTVHGEATRGEAFVGFGANMNPWIFALPNRDGITEKNAAELERKIIDLRPQHVRVFFDNGWVPDPSHQAKHDTKIYDSFVRVAHMAQAAGASINLTANFDHAEWQDPGRAAGRLAFNIARLIDREHLSAIRFITIQNEPNEVRVRPENIVAMDKYVQAYLAFDNVMRKLGMRDRVKIIAGDLVSNHEAEWIPYLGSHLFGIADGYSIHVYWDYFDSEKISRRLAESEHDFAALPMQEQKPLYITEFGTRGHDWHHFDPGLDFDGRPIAMTPRESVLDAWFMIQAVNDGFLSLVQWDMYDAHYSRILMHYGLMGEAKDGWLEKPGYFLMKLLTHTCEPGWRAMRVEGDATTVTAAAMKSDGGEMTIWAVNHGPREAVANFSGVRAGERFRVWYWNADEKCGLTEEGMIEVDRREVLSVTIPFQGVAAVMGED